MPRPHVRPNLGRRLQQLAGGCGLALLLGSLGAGSAIAQPSGKPGAQIDTAAVARAAGTETARRWCAGEPPMQAVEMAVVDTMASNRIDPDKLDQKTTSQLLRDILVEALSRSFSSCPQQTREVLRTILNFN